jgi:hypothetical protein
VKAIYELARQEWEGEEFEYPMGESGRFGPELL